MNRPHQFQTCGHIRSVQPPIVHVAVLNVRLHEQMGLKTERQCSEYLLEKQPWLIYGF